MTEPVPTVPDPEDLPEEREVVGVYDYCGGEVLYCVAETTGDDRWIAVGAGTERSLEDWR